MAFGCRKKRYFFTHPQGLVTEIYPEFKKMCYSQDNDLNHIFKKVT